MDTLFGDSDAAARPFFKVRKAARIIDDSIVSAQYLLICETYNTAFERPQSPMNNLLYLSTD